jgi:peroxiredoxin
MSQILAAGKAAPDFRLRVTPDQWLSLSDLKGRLVIIAFYPADWSPVCGDEVRLYNEILPEFHKHNVELLGISVDGAWCHAAYIKDRRLHFPLLADFHSKGAVAKSYGAYNEQEGVAERALFVLDKEGHRFLELSLADGGQPRSRRNPRRVGANAERKEERPWPDSEFQSRSMITSLGPSTRRSRWSNTAISSVRCAVRRIRSSRPCARTSAGKCASCSGIFH